MARNTVQSLQGNVSMNPIRLTSTDTPRTLAEGIAALTTDFTFVTKNGFPAINTGNIRKDPQQATGATIIVTANDILIGMGTLVPTFADLIDTTLTATAVIDAGQVKSVVTGITANQVTLTAVSVTGMQVGMKVVITVTDNYNGTRYIESISGSTFNIAAAFVAETTSTSDLIKSPDAGFPVVVGQVYELESTEDVRNFRYVSAATITAGILNIDLRYGG